MLLMRASANLLPIQTEWQEGLAGGGMQGFMRQRGQAWEQRVYLGRDPVSGRKRWATKTVRGGKREAQRVLTALVAEADKGALASTQATVGELNRAQGPGSEFTMHRHDDSPAVGMSKLAMAASLRDLLKSRPGATDVRHRCPITEEDEGSPSDADVDGSNNR
ncbi:MAG TPA: hypothetical protein VMZ51_04495 [Acidimicrobiales bacterium]|nr:hypothetical protein [Acidimicrobiales bacterium]